ncbi:ComEA family DNA-binding protein [Microbispora triticiradicis]|nr:MULTISPECIES: helix-hairpin-helix domain-containing protein [Microbispora]GLW23512.1 hypothetical protein Mame01_35550 [Microbispora amethystogenes]
MNGYGGPGGYPPAPQGPPNPYYGGYPPPPPQPPSGAASVFWALVPLFTCGAGTPFTMLYAAVRRRSAALGLSAAGYAALTAAWLYNSVVYEDVPTPWPATAAIVIGALGPWLGGTLHSFLIRKRVFGLASQPSTLNEHALAVAQHRRTLRQQARELAERDPAMARELRIGRPDLPRQYDDGGLVDLNRAPAPIIASLPGMTLALADQVVRVREQVGGFVSAEDVSAAASLPPHLTADLAEYGIFLS